MSLDLLDPSDEAERAAYERAFHAAFQRVPGNRLVRSLWLWDHAAGRVATRIPYDDQIVYLIRLRGTIDGALAVNIRLARFQSRTYGFAPPADPTCACEFLTFFSASDRRFATKLRFMRRCFADLHLRGFRTGYTTASPRIYKIYRRFGVTLLDQAEIQGEQRFFLAVDLAQSAGGVAASQAGGLTPGGRNPAVDLGAAGLHELGR